MAEMNSGAQLGLAERRQDTDENEAADRLRLAYDQLHSQETLAAQAEKQRLDQEGTANALRSRELDIMQKYHEGMVQNAKDRLNADGGADPFVPSSMEVAGHTLLQMGPNRYQLAPERKPTPFRVNPVDIEQSKIYSRQITALQKAMDATDDPKTKNDIGLALQGARVNLNELRSRFVAPPPAGAALAAGMGTNAPAMLPPPAGAPGAAALPPAAGAALAPSPYKEGAIIRSKKDPSKRFVIQGGVPVPMAGFGAPKLDLSAGASLSSGADDSTDDGTDDGTDDESDTEQ